MRTETRMWVGARRAALGLLTVLAGCAQAPVLTTPATPANASAGHANPAAVIGSRQPPCVARADDLFNRCALPADVRNFIDDSELCEHFRSEPWPEGSSDADRVRRGELVGGVRTTCAGLAPRLRALRSLHHDDAASGKALGAIDIDDLEP